MGDNRFGQTEKKENVGINKKKGINLGQLRILVPCITSKNNNGVGDNNVTQHPYRCV